MTAVYRHATFRSRFAASIIDMVVVLGLFGALVAKTAQLLTASEVLSLQEVHFITGIPYALVFFFYEPVFLAIMGQTLGKKLLKIRVCKVNGENINFWQALGRFWLKAMIYPVAFLIRIGPSRLPLHDYLTKSIVISTREMELKS